MTFPDALCWAGFAILLIGPPVRVVMGNATPGNIWATAAVGAFIVATSCVLVGALFPATAFGVWAGICAYLWWRNRRNGRWKRAARELGAKSRARVEALARQMTPSPIPTLVGGS